MVGLLFHVLYLLGKCIYESYYVKRTRVLHDTASEPQPFDDSHDHHDNFDNSDDFSEDSSWWVDKPIGRFFPPAHIQRYCAVRDVLAEYKGKLRKIVDFGCSELGFLVYLKEIPEVQEILCVDVDKEVLERCGRKAAPLTAEYLSSRERMLSIEVYQGSVTDNDTKLKNTNAVICIELIEHLYPDTLIDLPFNIFGYIKPEVAVITTPNVEFNVTFPQLSGYRHPDHKFEWTREQFQDWAQNIVVRYPYYNVTFHGICNGSEGTEELGALTQMAVFHRTLPRNQSIMEILTDEYFQLKGQDNLFKTIVTYDYFMRSDTRSDEQKILDEAVYYIYDLSYNTDDEDTSHEVNLDRLLHFMTKYPITIETLRSILTNAGWTVVDRENGPVVLNPPEDSDYEMRLNSDIDERENEDDERDNEYENYEEINFTNEENRWDNVTNSVTDEIPADANEESLSQQNPYIESRHEESNVINEENRWDYVTNSSTDEIPADANEEYLSQQNLYIENWHEEPNVTNEENRWDYVTNPPIDEISADANEEYLSQQNPYTGNWHEESSIIIPQNCSIDQENTYLFDGENSLIEESQSPKESCTTVDDIKYLSIGNTAKFLVYTERDLPIDSVPLTLNETEVEAQATVSNMSATAFNNSSQLKNSVDNITIEPALLQNDQINLRPTQEVTLISNFQSHMFISRSSTSPASLYFGSELNNSLQDFSAYYQNESSINDQCLSNNTFHQSKIKIIEAAMNTEKFTAEDIPFKESLPEKATQESERNFSLHVPPNYYNCNVEQGRDVSDKNQIYEDSNMADTFNNQPKYTSSPHTKMSVTNIVSKSSKRRELIPAMNSNALVDITEEIKETISDTISNSLLEDSQKSNNITKTIKSCAISSSSDITNTLRYDVDFSASDSTQQKLCLENKEFSSVDNSISTKLKQEINQEFIGNDIIHRESDVDDIQNVDVHHVLSSDSDESINRKDKNVHSTLATKTNTDVKAHLENVISDLAQSNIRKKDLNPPRELLNSMSQNVSKYSSSDCAKESSVLRNDRFIPCKSSENTSNIHFTSLKSEENVSTSKDVSNIAGLANNVEIKPSSPFETPPNSWSPEIMDSGYPNSASAQDITPEYDLSSIAQDHIPDSESPSIAEAPRLGVLEPIEVENGDLANNNRDDEGNNMMAVDANDIENLQPLIDVLENDLENENDIYVMQNGFPIWLLRILDMANPLDFDMQARQNLRIPDEVADDADYVGHDEGFDSSSESESDVAYNEMENDNGHGK